MDKKLAQSRSNLYEQVKKNNVGKRKTEDDSADLNLIRHVTDERPSYGYRRVTAILKHRDKQQINHRHVYRIMKENGVSLLPFDMRPKMRRCDLEEISALKL